MKKYFPMALTTARILRDRCIEMLNKAPAFCGNGKTIETENFAFTVNDDGCLDFWRKGQKDKKCARLTPPHRSIGGSNLCIFEPSRRTILTDFAGARIEEYFNEMAYPKTKFEWSGWESGSMKIGDLYFARVDLKGNEFVNYYQHDDFQGKANAHHNPQPVPKIAPMSIKDGDNFFGQKVKMKIDFDARANAILKESELTAFANECMAFSK